MQTKLDEVSLLSVVFTMVGNSMDNDSKRCFVDGDILRCDEVSIEEVQLNREYVIQIDDTFIVRQITMITDDELTATPFNASYEECTFEKNRVQKIFLVKSCQRKIADDIN